MEREYEYSVKLVIWGHKAERINSPFENESKCFGPGVARLLRAVDETGSLYKAAQSFGMAYSRAWRIVRMCESQLDGRLLETKTGGRDGGGAKLSPLGRELMRRYDAFYGELTATADALFEKHFGDFTGELR